jgi:excisionase family DNA binding protein
VIAITAENPDDLLSPERITAELQAAGIRLTPGNLQAMIAAARAEAGAKAEAREIELFPLKACLPLHVSYETGRRACASGALRATKIGGDWFVTREAVSEWLASSGKFFESESAVQKWRTAMAALKPKWIA